MPFGGSTAAAKLRRLGGPPQFRNGGFCTDSACFSIVLAPTRWKLRAAIRVVNEALAELKVQQHPDKTFVGWIAAGFEFLGFRYNSAGLTVME